MSLLYDALQKAHAQRERKRKLFGEEKPVTSFDELKVFEKRQQVALEEGHEKKGRQKSYWLTFFVIVFLATVLPLSIFYFILSRFSKEKHTLSSPAVEVIADGERSILSDREKTTSTKTRVVKIQKVARREGIKPAREVTSSSIGGARRVLVKRTTKIPEFRCTGILEDRDGRYCFLNGLIARVGDVVDGARVLEIGKKAVLLDYKGTRLEVPLPAI